MNSGLTHAGNFGGFALARCLQQLPDLPGENGRVFPFAADDGGDDPGRENPRPAPPDAPRLQESGPAVAAQDLADAAVGNLKDAVCSTLFNPNHM